MNPLLVGIFAIGSLLTIGSLVKKAMAATPGIPPDPTPPGRVFLNPPGWRRAKGSEVTPAIGAQARTFLSRPIGSFEVFDSYAIGLESHYHEPGGPARPWGWHKGATVYVKQKGYVAV